MKPIDYSRYDGWEEVQERGEWNMARIRLETDAPMLLEACRERDAEIERLREALRWVLTHIEQEE
jgi:hypothetical protein